MKRLACIVAFILLTGCAAKHQPNTIMRPALINKVNYWHIKISDCMGIEAKDRPQLAFIESSEPCAQTDGNEVLLCTGLFARHNNATVWFVHAHELAHVKLNHYGKSVATSVGITGAFIVAGFFVPGIGALNQVVSPAITNNLSKSQEYDADKLATESLNRCFKMPAKNQVHALQVLQRTVGPSGGGFWSTHPSWDDRIANIRKIQSPSSTPVSSPSQD